MAIDPRQLRPSMLTRMLNSTPLGEVISERQLRRHRNRAGYRCPNVTRPFLRVQGGVLFVVLFPAFFRRDPVFGIVFHAVLDFVHACDYIIKLHA